MSKITRFKRALAVMMSLVLLFSAMAVAGVSAAVTGTAYHYTFDNTADSFNYNGDYFSSSHVHNAYNSGSYGVTTQLVTGGYNGSSQAMKMAYTANLSAQETKWHAAFSLPNNTTERLEDRNPTQTAYLVAGGTYEISVTYKVTGYRSAAALYYAQGMGALGAGDRAEFAQCNPLKLADITGTTGWNTARVILPSAVKTGGYIVLKMADDTNRTGTEVLIGKVDVVPIDPSAKTTVTFNANGGSAVSPVIGDVGTPIPYPAAPTKDGYTFVGWFTESGEAAPANFPSSGITLIARWSDPTVWGFESETVGTPISVAHHHHATNRMTPTNEAARSGLASARVDSKYTDGNLRAQMLIKDAQGQIVTVEQGKTYDVSFWLMIPAGQQNATFPFWLAATPDGDPFDANRTVDGVPYVKNNFALYEVNDVNGPAVTANGQWVQVSVTLADVARTGQLRLGIADSSNNQESYFYIDDVKVAEKIIIPAEEGAWSFEKEAVNATVSVAHRYHEYNSFTVTDEAVHTGGQSARAFCRYNDGNYRPQLMVKDVAGKTVTIEKGKTYYVTFWLMVPHGQPDLTFRYWIAATPNGDEFNADRTEEGVPYKKDNFVVLEQDGVTVAADGQWVKIDLTLENASRAGQMRLGITDHLNGTNTTFYLDDIKVKQAGEVITEGFAMQDFESAAAGDELHINNDPRPTITTTIVTTDEIAAHSGTLSAKVTSNTNNGDIRPQMMVKDPSDNQFKVYKGRNYEVKFWVYMPGNSAVYGFSYWLAATPDAKPFNMVDYRKSDYVLAEVSNGTQPELGRWTEITVAINDCPRSGLLRLGVTGNNNDPHSFYIDDITVTELLSTPADDVNSFETHNDGDTLSINTDANAIDVTSDEQHAGDRAAAIHAIGNGINTTPQMVLENVYDEPISVTAGKQYNIEFWVMVPESEADYDLQYWLAATDDDAPFTDANPLTDAMAPTAAVTVSEQGVWQRVTLKIEDCTVTGTLRLGISGTVDAPHTFYIDDVLVEEFVILPADTDAMNFESIALGTELSLTQHATSETVRKNWVKVTDEKAYTGTQSAYFHAYTSAGDARPQINVTDAEGNQIKLEKGEDYYISFKVLLSEDVEFSYWAACVPDDKLNEPFQYGTDFVKNDYVVMENSRHVGIFPGDWTEVRVPITDCQHGGNLRVGFTHYAANNKDFYFYIDDIKVEPPQYVLVKFDTNGAEDEYPDKQVLSGSIIFTEDDIMPYRNGYEFMGWYTNKECTKDAYFDAYATPVVGETGDVLTLYACWRKWDNADLGGSLGNRDEEDVTIEYKTEYYTEQVWVGDQNVAKPLDIGERPDHKDAAPIVVTPDEVVPQPENGMPPWIIVVIIVAAVAVVGGGAAVAAILIKKSKKA